MWPFDNITNRMNKIITENANTALTDTEFIMKQIDEFKGSIRRKMMIDGERYFDGQHDILQRKRKVIGEDGKLEEIDNLPNNHIVDNQYKKMVKQKYNYLLGQPLTVHCDNKIYEDILKQIFKKQFMKTLKNVCKDSLNCGIGWIHVYYDNDGQLQLKRTKPYECIPMWKDADHTILDSMIRYYPTVKYEGKDTKKIIEMVEVYNSAGIFYFVIDDSGLVPAEPYYQAYFNIGDQPYNWTKVPFIPFKYGEEENSLLTHCKSLQDGMNLIESNFQNNMEEDTRNTILVLVNYDGQNLGEFRRNLATYGAVKVRNDGDGRGGDVKTLQVEVNCENYKAILDIFKRAIIENCMGYDAKDERLGGQPNQMNIQSMYQDIDLDANDMETEYQASFEELIWFINCHLANTGLGNFENEQVDIIFNRDMMLNESEVIQNINNSSSILSQETLVSQHPWVDDVQAELERINKEKEEKMEQFGGMDMFNPPIQKDEGGEE